VREPEAAAEELVRSVKSLKFVGASDQRPNRGSLLDDRRFESVLSGGRGTRCSHLPAPAPGTTGRARALLQQPARGMPAT
jgi:predicted TIM-barrel fold metal-dependent hydrolase